jgi:hypothetical protein
MQSLRWYFKKPVAANLGAFAQLYKQCSAAMRPEKAEKKLAFDENQTPVLKLTRSMR